MGIVSWIIMGGLAGWVASKIMKRDRAMGLLANIFIGIVGGIVGGWVASLFGLGTVDGFNLSSFLIALGGACLLLLVTGFFKRK